MVDVSSGVCGVIRAFCDFCGPFPTLFRVRGGSLCLLTNLA